MRNRMYGGERGLRGQPLTLLDGEKRGQGEKQSLTRETDGS